MPDIFDFHSLPPDYLDDCVRNLDVGRAYPVRSQRWQRIPLDLLPLRSERLHDGSAAEYFVLSNELIEAICRGLGGCDCGEGEEPFARWLKSKIAIRRHAMRLKP